jgi:hypothetical protein
MGATSGQPPKIAATLGGHRVTIVTGISRQLWVKKRSS